MPTNSGRTAISLWKRRCGGLVLTNSIAYDAWLIPESPGAADGERPRAVTGTDMS
ncbi:MAG: hypothetical protein M3O70_17635 [Actinomycetota bacterium]|nr:hypothetical protein [Actinomycetota bacterium]